MDKLITLIYDPENGLAVPDARVLETARNLYKYNQDIVIGSELLLFAFRIMVLRKEIKPNLLLIMYKEHYLNIDETGRIDRWPNGFCDYADRFHEELLGLSSGDSRIEYGQGGL